MSVKVKEINKVRDRKSGKVYYYHRPTKTRLPSPDSPDFLDEVVAARAKAKKNGTANTSTKDRSFRLLIAKYQKSDEYLYLAPLTKKEYDRHLATLGSLLGSYPHSPEVRIA
jgi:hypothetical protein